MRLSSLRPRYFFRRIRQIRFTKQYPGAPWLTEPACHMLDSWIKPADVGIEWGSGRSTVWFAHRSKHVLSIEHYPNWHQRVCGLLKESGVGDRVDYRLVPLDIGEYDEPANHPYCDAADALANGSVDYALVDGMLRMSCMRVAMRKLKPGGLLILDNANRFFPNISLGLPATVVVSIPRPLTPAWADLQLQLASWRSIFTTDGIWDTRFWIKP